MENAVHMTQHSGLINRNVETVNNFVNNSNHLYITNNSLTRTSPQSTTINDTYVVNLKIGSINTNGYLNNIDYINTLSMYTDILFLCETWHSKQSDLDNSLSLLNKKIFAKTGLKTSTKGRFPGGIAFIVNSELNTSCRFVTRRIVTLKINKLLLIGVYLTYCDGSESNELDFQNEVDLLKDLTLNHVRQGYDIVVLGDFNTDFTRSDKHREALLRYMHEFKLAPADIYKAQTSDFTFYKKCGDKLNTSWIDHILVNSSMTGVNDCKISTSLLNMSDHNALLMDYSVNCSKSFKKSHNESIPNLTLNLNWNCIDQKLLFQEYVSKGLLELSFDILQLKNENNKLLVQKRMTEIMPKVSHILINAVTKTYNYFKNNVTKKKKYKRRFNSWWDSSCQDLFNQVRICYIKYKLNNFVCPKLKEQLKVAKNNFRAKKRFNIKIKRDFQMKTLSKLFKMSKNQFWSELKKMKNESQTVDINLNTITDEYEKVFNVENNRDVGNNAIMKSKVDEFLNNYVHSVFSSNISLATLKENISKLETKKATGISGITNEMLLYSNETAIPNVIKLIFDKCISFSITPLFFNICIIKPLVKNINKESNTIDNLRPVAISDVISNLFEGTLLSLLTQDYVENIKQFGFRKNSSCSHAVFALKQAIKYCKSSFKRVYVCAIDLSKAFDKVNRTHLWAKMIDKGVNPYIILAIRSYYADSQMIIINGTECGKLFRTTVGVRQGGVISPKLFNLYIDDLPLSIDATNSGIDIGSIRINCIMYADDVLLIARTKTELKTQLEALEKYSSLNDLKINASKTNFILFNEKICKKPSELELDSWQGDLVLDGEVIQRVQQMKYLGYMLTDNDLMVEHVKKRKQLTSTMIAQMKNQGLLDQNLDVKAKVILFKSFIRSTLLYGFENVILTEKVFNEIRTFEGNFIKTMIEIPKRCHTTELLSALNIVEPKLFLTVQKLSFFNRLISNDYTNAIINEMSKLKYLGSFTNEITNLLGIDAETSLENIKVKVNIKLSELNKIKTDLKKTSNERIDKIKILVTRRDYKSKNELFNLLKH